MTTKTKDGVCFDFTNREVIDSISYVKNMRNYFKTLEEEGVEEAIKALDTALEIMTLFWCKNFEEGDKDEGNM